MSTLTDRIAGTWTLLSEPRSFRQWAYQACLLERAEQYVQASEAWERAGEKACNESNRAWSRARAMFCEAMAKKNGEPVSRSWTSDALLRGR